MIQKELKELQKEGGIKVGKCQWQDANKRLRLKSGQLEGN